MAERAKAIEGYGPERYAAHQRAMAGRPDRRDYFKTAGIPLLVVAVDNDVVIPTERQADMAVQLGADFITIKQAGHMLPAEQPECLANAAMGWPLDGLNDGAKT